jgi:hypothetical protein
MPEDSMDFINLDLTDVDDGSEPLPTGQTHFRIKSATKKHKEGSEYPYVELRLNPLNIAGREKRSLPLRLSFHPDAVWNMKRLFKAVDFYQEGAKQYALRDLIGREFWGEVALDKEGRNEVKPPYSKA